MKRFLLMLPVLYLLLLVSRAEATASKTKFGPVFDRPIVYAKGKLIYNFAPENNCEDSKSKS